MVALGASIKRSAQLLARGKLSAVLYSVPFRLVGRTPHERLYRFLMRRFHTRINEVGVRRRIQYVSADAVPASVTLINQVEYIRERYPTIFRKIARTAVYELPPYICDPLGSLTSELTAFVEEGRMCATTSTRRAIVKAHMPPLKSALRKGKRIRIYLPLGIAMDVCDELMLKKGFSEKSYARLVPT